MKRVLKPVFEAPPTSPDDESLKENDEPITAAEKSAEEPISQHPNENSSIEGLANERFATDRPASERYATDRSASEMSATEKSTGQKPLQSFAVNGVRDFFTYEEWVRLNQYLKVSVGLEAGPQFAPGLDAEGHDVAVLLQRLSKLIPPVNQRSPPAQNSCLAPKNFPSGEFQSLSLQR